MPLGRQEAVPGEQQIAAFCADLSRAGRTPPCLFSRSGAVFNLILAAVPPCSEISAITRISRGEERAAVTPG